MVSHLKLSKNRKRLVRQRFTIDAELLEPVLGLGDEVDETVITEVVDLVNVDDLEADAAVGDQLETAAVQVLAGEQVQVAGRRTCKIRYLLNKSGRGV